MKQLTLTAEQCLRACERIMKLNSYYMRKLLCVKSPNGAEYSSGMQTDDFTTIYVGNEYEASGILEFEDGVYYKLVGFNPTEVYHSDLFATLPDNTADEMAEEEQFIYEPFSC